MRSVVTSFHAHEVQVVLTLISCFSIAFLVCFLVALIREQMQARTKRWALGKTNHQVRFAIHKQYSQTSRVWLVRIDSGRARLGSLKMLWLIAGILLSTTTRLLAQNPNQAQPTAPPSPLPTPSIT